MLLTRGRFMTALKNFIIFSFVFNLAFFSKPVTANSQSPRLFINEFMASNQGTKADNNGEYEDWIEIYNGEDFDISLASYYLTDDLANPQKWAFPAIILPAKGYLLIWADDQLNQSGVHANFKLDKDGEQIGLYKAAAVVDSITYGPQATDVSYGRRSDGNPDWVRFEPSHNPPTPAAANQFVDVQILAPPNFSLNDGFYAGPIAIQLSSDDPNAQIYYTLDGSIPTKTSMQYIAPIYIISPTTLRAICYKQIEPETDLSSEVVTHCYLVDIDNAFPLIDIACDPDEHDDIYSYPEPGAPHGSIPAHFKYFDSDHVLQGDLPVELSMRGGFSLLSPKRSYQIDFNRQNFQFDPFDQDYNDPRLANLPASFHSINLSGMAADYSLIRNYLSFQLLKNAGAIAPQVAFARLFINGIDQGIYIEMERVDKWFAKNRFGNYDYDIIKSGIEHKCALTMDNENGQYFELKEGDFDAFNEFIIWLNNGGHSYEELDKKIDIPSFLYYDLMCRFSNNKDSYDINYYLIKNRDVAGSKWIILLWDTDESFGWDSNVHGNWYPYNEAFHQLRGTEEYIYLYQNRLADLMNGRWSRSEVSKLVVKLEGAFQTDNPADERIWNETWYDYAEGIIPEMTEDPNYNPLSRYTQFNYIKVWSGERIDFEFGLWGDSTALLTIEPPAGGEGSIQLNSLQVPTFPWTGTYFKEIPIQISATPGPGFIFLGWSDSTVSQTEQISITLHDDYAIHARFRSDPLLNRLVINEINYNSAPDFNPEDWIELYNPMEKQVDVSGWHLKDDDDAHDFVIPNGTRIDPLAFLVICRDAAAFHRLFPEVANYIGNMDFGLANGGDQVRIFNSSLLLIDSVAYDDRAPWPELPDGEGPTLELIDPGLTNTMPENWQASLWHGTPGQKNSFRIVINEINYSSAAEFNPDDWIELYNPSARTVDISGWYLKDDGNTNAFRFPTGTTIPSYSFLIVCYNKTIFQSLFPGVTNSIGNFKFWLDPGGDEVKLYNESYNLVDSVHYDDQKPWPIEANGSGATLELLDPELDNAIAQHWQASANHGSPGQPTHSLPVVIHFIARDSSGSNIVTNSRDVVIEMIETDFDGQVMKWHINESGIPPLPADFAWENRPTSYHIESKAGDVSLFGWVLDNENQVSRLTDTSYATIRLVLGRDLLNISGSVNYIKQDRPVPDVILSLAYFHGTAFDTTDEAGSYVFVDTDTGQATLLPSRQGDIRGAIRGSDALYVLQYLANMVMMTDNEKLAADVIEDGKITPADAQAILRNLIFYTQNIGNAGQWRFMPADTSIVLRSNFNVNFKTYLSGDANLDWGESSVGDSLYSNVTFKLNQVSAHRDQFITVPLTVETDTEAVRVIVISLQYDPLYLIYQEIEKTDLSNDFLTEANGTQSGKVHIAMAGVKGIKSSDVLLKLRFKVVDPLIENGHTQLTFLRAMVNDRIAKSFNGVIIFTDTSDTEPVLPQDFALLQNYPNPFNSETLIRFQLANPADIRLTIYNLMGHEIRTIVKEKNKSAGSYQVNWDGKDKHGTETPSGIYVYELRSDKLVQRKKMIRVK